MKNISSDFWKAINKFTQVSGELLPPGMRKYDNRNNPPESNELFIQRYNEYISSQHESTNKIKEMIIAEINREISKYIHLRIMAKLKSVAASILSRIE